MTTSKADIFESRIPKDILDVLLRDRTTQRNIFWATKDYEQWGKGYAENDEITYEKIADNDKIIPRVLKNKTLQTARSHGMAEVFTPSWVCNAQNNLVDNAWFGREDVFNIEVVENGVHSWIPTNSPVEFPDGKSWENYVRENRMEITCGEAPYITSRYDTTTGEPIPVNKRIGLLDRKLRIVNENIHSSGEWLSVAQDACKSIYGFEWQGDSLLLARENVLHTVIDHYHEKFGEIPSLNDIKDFAKIISWNLWQMDGLKFVIPNSCHIMKTSSQDLFGDTSIKEHQCEGCAKGDFHKHNGIYCKIKDWKAGNVIKFVSLIKK